jgi:hypothetical protein
MHIYIDESGTFTIPTIKKQSVSCVVALIVPDRDYEAVIESYNKLRSFWGYDGEVKGSSLNENQISDVILMLNQYDVLVEICCMDSGLHSEAQVGEFKELQARKIEDSVTNRHQPSLIKDVKAQANYLRLMANQLFLQSFCTIYLIKQVLQTSTLYYSQRIPSELKEFNWIVDRKDLKITRYEKWWSSMILPFLQSMSLQQPLLVSEKGDYSYFRRFEVRLDELPDHLKSDFKGNVPPPYFFDDIKKIMNESFIFENSGDFEGLQLVDIIANAFRRATNQKLKKDCWEKLGKLIVYKRDQSVQTLIFNAKLAKPTDSLKVLNHVGFVIEELEKKMKPMLL